MLHVHRYISVAIVMIVLCDVRLHAQHTVAPADLQMVELDGRAVRVQSRGLENRRPGQSVVVFEAGAMNSLDVWRNVLPQVAASAPVVAYDRAGLGRSEWDDTTPTPHHVVSRLRRLLQQIGADPPYVLVGYSWGAILARYFAGYHPEDVAGLVFIDPGPLVTLSPAEDRAPFDEIGAGQAGSDAFWSTFATLLAPAPAPVRAEFEVFRELMHRDPADRDLRPVPDVPVAVIVAAKYLALPVAELPYDPQAHFEASVHHRMRELQEWALASPNGTLVMSNHTTHAVPREDPELIIWTVRRVLSAISSQRD